MARTITSMIKEKVENNKMFNSDQLTELYFILDKASELEKRKIIADFEFGMIYQRHDDTITGEKYYKDTYTK
jgi:hypothetical protein